MPAVDPKSPLTILGASGVALFVFMLLPWYGVDAFGASLNGSAWEVFSYTDILLLLAAVSAVASFGLVGQRHPQAETAVRAAAGLGALCTLLVLYRIVNQPGPNAIINVKIGAFLGLIACGGIVFGALRTMAEGTATYTPPVR